MLMGNTKLAVVKIMNFEMMIGPFRQVPLTVGLVKKPLVGQARPSRRT
jgi:hypothetical protein